MSEQSSTIISKVWGMCNPLRDDGVSYGDYLEQLTYLIFLKMSDEYARPPYNKQTGIPAGYTWADMNTLKGAELEEKYKAILEELGVDLTQRVAIVTSDYHLCRARLMWGGDTAAVPAHLPSALYFQCLTVNYFIREAFGLAAYFVYGG